jgi:diaminopimelate decarboxylase
MSIATRTADPTGAADPRRDAFRPAVDGAPSPVVVIDLDRAVRRFRDLREALPWVDARYEVTALAHPRLLATLAADGAGFTVASDAALDALRHVDADPRRVLHAVPGARWRDRRRAWDAGVRLFAVDDLHALDAFVGAPPGTAVLLRIPPETAASAARRAQGLGIRVAGLSLRLPAGAPAATVAAELRRASAAHRAIAAATGRRPGMLDLGEILASRASVRPADVAELARSVRSLVAPATFGTVVTASLGRAVVADCITIVSGSDERYADPATASGYIDAGAEVVIVRARPGGRPSRILRRPTRARTTWSPAG